MPSQDKPSEGQPFEGRTVVITGSARGIGADTAAAFAALGANLVVADIDEELARTTAATLPRAIAVGVDVADPVAVHAMVDAASARFGAVDVLVNNAMSCSETPFLAASAAELRRDLEVVLLGSMLCTQAVLPTMIERGGGVILNVASVNGLAYFGNDAYSAAKAGVLSLTRSTASQFGEHGVRCNAVAPGTIATPYWQHRLDLDPHILDEAAQWYPMGRVGRPRDVSDALVFLASDQAAWISGAVLPVDGGLLTGNLAMARQIVPQEED